MQQYRSSILLAAIFLLIGSASPTSGEKELIVKLQGEVLVLQRQIRDLQESFDKWQGQSSASLQKISENTTSTAREMSDLEEVLKNTQLSNRNNLAGTTAQLQNISEQISRQGQHFSGLSQEIEALKRSVQEYQQKLEAQQAQQKLESQLRSEAGRSEAGRSESARSESARSESEGQRTAAQELFTRGTALLHQERRSEGIETLKTVVSRYPDSPEAAAAKNELNRLGEDYALPSKSSAAPSTTANPSATPATPATTPNRQHPR